MRTVRPCLNCRRLTRAGSRCEDCEKKHAKLYDYEYRQQAKLIRESATLCHICGQAARPDDPWTADHIRPGDKTSPLAAAHRSCNTRKSNKRIPIRP
jgi:hypothetical protein